MSSGRLFHRAVEPAVVQAHLSMIVNAVAAANAVACVRCSSALRSNSCSGPEPGSSVSISSSRCDQLCARVVARCVGVGVGLLLSCVPAQIDVSRSDTGVSAPLRRFMERAGFAQVPSNVAISPTSGLAHVSPEGARTVMDACIRVGAVVRDEHSEPVHG